ncbi:hypothetical protein GCM10010433_59520 [Streptomyces pulveraceus]
MTVGTRCGRVNVWTNAREGGAGGPGEEGNARVMHGKLTARDGLRWGFRRPRPSPELGFPVRPFSDMNVNAGVLEGGGRAPSRSRRPGPRTGSGVNRRMFRHEPAGERAQSGNACALPDVLLDEHEEER